MERGILERQRLGITWLVLLFALPAASGQILQIQAPPAAAPGEWVALEIRYQAPPGQEFIALQWDAEMASAPLDRGIAPLVRAPLVINAAGKSTACGAARKSGEDSLLPCLLAGSSKPIPNGTILLLSLKLSDRARPGEWHIRIQHGIALDPGLKQTAIEPVDAVVTIRGQ